MTSTQKPHVAVLGGGIIGVSIAVHLLRRGTSVELITEGKLCSGASGRSLSWLNSAGERSLEYHALRMAGIDRYRTLHARLPAVEWLEFGGGLFWSGDESSTKARHAYEKKHAYDSLLVDSESIDTYTPNVNPDAIRPPAIFNPGEGWVSLPHLIDHLMDEFHALDGKLRTDCSRCSVHLDKSGRCDGIETENGHLHRSDRVVVACGPQTPEIVAALGVAIPNGSPVSMLVTTQPLEHGVKCVMNTPRAAIRPNPASSLAADHDWYEDDIEGSETEGYRVPTSVIEELLNEASQLIRAKPRLEVGDYKLGRKPIPGDGEPVLGELKAVPGCFVAFTHSGATLALVVGELLADEILTGTPHPMLDTFRPERFER